MNERKSLDRERAHLKLNFQVGHENHLVLHLSYLRRDGRLSLFAACLPPKNSKNPTRKFGISASDFCSFSSLLFFKSVSKFSSRDISAIKTNFEFSGRYGEIRGKTPAVCYALRKHLKGVSKHNTQRVAMTRTAQNPRLEFLSIQVIICNLYLEGHFLKRGKLSHFACAVSAMSPGWMTLAFC